MIKQWPIFILLLALISCGTEQPPNPFDIGTGEPVDTANLTGFAALHEKFRTTLRKSRLPRWNI